MKQKPVYSTDFTPVFKIFKEGRTTDGPVKIMRKNGEPFDVEAKKAFYVYLGYTILPL